MSTAFNDLPPPPPRSANENVRELHPDYSWEISQHTEVTTQMPMSHWEALQDAASAIQQDDGKVLADLSDDTLPADEAAADAWTFEPAPTGHGGFFVSKPQHFHNAFVAYDSTTRTCTQVTAVADSLKPLRPLEREYLDGKGTDLFKDGEKPHLKTLQLSGDYSVRVFRNDPKVSLSPRLLAKRIDDMKDFYGDDVRIHPEVKGWDRWSGDDSVDQDLRALPVKFTIHQALPSCSGGSFLRNLGNLGSFFTDADATPYHAPSATSQIVASLVKPTLSILEHNPISRASPTLAECFLKGSESSFDDAIPQMVILEDADGRKSFATLWTTLSLRPVEIQSQAPANVKTEDGTESDSEYVMCDEEVSK